MLKTPATTFFKFNNFITPEMIPSLSESSLILEIPLNRFEAYKTRKRMLKAKASLEPWSTRF